MKNSSPDHNKRIKKQRVMRYFIDAAREIINEEGIEGVTIRNVAGRAGYNSASLYNYFENLDMLIAYTCIDLISGWLWDLMHILEGKGDELDKYIWGWKRFFEEAMKNPAIYAYVFSTGKSKDIFKHINGYMDVFADEFENKPKSFVEMCMKDSLRGQEEVMIEPCIRDGFFKQEDAEKVYDIAMILHNGLIWKAMQAESQKERDNLVDTSMRYFLDYVGIYLQKEKDLSVYLKKSAKE